MVRKMKVTGIVCMAFLGGALTHSQLYAKISRDPATPQAFRSASESLPKSVITTMEGLASWYSENDPGIRLRTANNEIFDDTAMTCAMWGVPFGQQIKVTNKANGQSVIVRVNDRGPHPRFVQQGRVVDLSKNAFRQIGGLHKGLLNVDIEFL
jgi:rare lipoprotein A